MYKAFPMKNAGNKAARGCSECGKRPCTCKKPGKSGKSRKKC